MTKYSKSVSKNTRQNREKELEKMKRAYMKEIELNLGIISDVKKKVYDNLEIMETLDILKLEFLDNYEESLIDSKKSIEDGTHLGFYHGDDISNTVFAYIDAECDNYRLPDEYLRSDIEILERCLQDENERYRRRLRRYNRQIETNAPSMIYEKERRLLKESLTIIELLKYYLEQNKYWLLTPEERLLKELFGE